MIGTVAQTVGSLCLLMEWGSWTGRPATRNEPGHGAAEWFGNSSGPACPRLGTGRYPVQRVIESVSGSRWPRALLAGVTGDLARGPAVAKVGCWFSFISGRGHKMVLASTVRYCHKVCGWYWLESFPDMAPAAAVSEKTQSVTVRSKGCASRAAFKLAASRSDEFRMIPVYPSSAPRALP